MQASPTKVPADKAETIVKHSSVEHVDLVAMHFSIKVVEPAGTVWNLNI
jgi:hypothetical protein